MIFIKTLILPLLLQHLALTCGYTLLGHHNPPDHSLLTDKAALLSFKKTITHDPNSTFANWDEAVDVCNFTGVTCDKHLYWKILNSKGCFLLSFPISLAFVDLWLLATTCTVVFHRNFHPLDISANSGLLGTIYMVQYQTPLPFLPNLLYYILCKTI